MSATASEIDALVNRLAQGDQQALAELFSRYHAPLKRMVALRLDHRLNGRVSPSDVLQEAYVDALQRLRHYFEKRELPFLGWLRLIVAQRMVDIHRQHLRAQQRDASLEISLERGLWPAASSQCLAAQLVGGLTSPSRAALRKEMLTQLADVLNRMEPMEREVLALRHFEELSNNEVAEILGIGKAAASKRYVRALARLKEALEAIPGFFDERPKGA